MSSAIIKLLISTTLYLKYRMRRSWVHLTIQFIQEDDSNDEKAGINFIIYLFSKRILEMQMFYHEEQNKGDIESIKSSCDCALLEYKAVLVGLGSEVIKGCITSSCCANTNDRCSC